MKKERLTFPGVKEHKTIDSASTSSSSSSSSSETPETGVYVSFTEERAVSLESFASKAAPVMRMSPIGMKLTGVPGLTTILLHPNVRVHFDCMLVIFALPKCDGG